MLPHYSLLVTRSTKEVMHARTRATRLKNQDLHHTNQVACVFLACGQAIHFKWQAKRVVKELVSERRSREGCLLPPLKVSPKVRVASKLLYIE